MPSAMATRPEMILADTHLAPNDLARYASIDSYDLGVKACHFNSSIDNRLT